ncbi:hypothetical protein vBVpaMR16F_192 [Vibrio phage vB_VpaM_R16F]|nr:hypothetical protein vBVpaMR16F_192 [Vibrio phage vB_VpaM_R16F]
MRIRYKQLRFCTWFYSKEQQKLLLRTDEMLGNDYLCVDLYGNVYYMDEHINVQEMILTENPKFKMGGI